MWSYGALGYFIGQAVCNLLLLLLSLTCSLGLRIALLHVPVFNEDPACSGTGSVN